MKIMKRIVSLVLTLTLLLGSVPLNAFAEENGTADTSVDTGNLSIEGSNSLGNLISDAVADEQAAQDAAEEEYEAGYTVTALEIEGNVATVTYDSLEEANLVVALYTEDGLRLVTSATAMVKPEEKTATVTIPGEMPEYFIATAYLLDIYDYSPLCPAYETPMYTRDMQELLAMTVEDCVEEYGEDRIYNLDEQSDTNFAVYSEHAVVIEEQAGVNTVVSADDETSTYVFDNADEQVAGLAAGDVVIYAYENEELLIFKVGSISKSGSTVTISGAEMELGDAFAVMKLENDGDTSDVEMDESAVCEGLEYTREIGRAHV